MLDLKIMTTFFQRKDSQHDLSNMEKRLDNIVHISAYDFLFSCFFLQTVNPAYYGLESTDSEIISSYLSR